MRYGKREHMGCSLEVGVAKALPVHMRKGIVMISDFYTEPQFRRQGYANTLLGLVAAEADVAGKMLLINVGDGETDGPDQRALAEFYHRHGFAVIQPEPMLMLRPHLRMRIAAEASPTAALKKASQ